MLVTKRLASTQGNRQSKPHHLIYFTGRNSKQANSDTAARLKQICSAAAKSMYSLR